MEHVVKISELDSGDDSPDTSPRLAHIENIIPFEFIEQAIPEAEQDVQDEGDEMDFCLFAPTPGKSQNAQQPVSRIRLKSPTPTNAEPGLENPHRDANYYFTKPPSPEELQRFASTAVSGQDIKARSYTSYPGSAYAWKVIHIQPTKTQALLLKQASAIYDKNLQADPSKRQRPGKQARIKLRTKAAILKAAEIEDQKAAEVKEIADREKRTRRNREKKAKKKVREKAKKAAAGNAGVQARDASSDDSEDESAEQNG